MRHRRNAKRCPACGKPVSTGTECLYCLQTFHNDCLNIVKLKQKRPSYAMCQKCLDKNPNPNREIVRPIKGVEVEA